MIQSTLGIEIARYVTSDKGTLYPRASDRRYLAGKVHLTYAIKYDQIQRTWLRRLGFTVR